MKHCLCLTAILICAGCSGSNTPTAPSGPTISFFVTSATSVTGNLGGLAGADATCQRLAQGAGHGGRTWRAYLSVERDATNGNQPTHARDRIGSGPWHNVNLVLVANNVTELHARTGDAAVFLDERGQRINGQWTGLVSNGMLAGRLIIEESQSLYGSARGGIAVQTRGGQSTLNPQNVTIATALKALPEVQVASGTIHLNGPDVTLHASGVGRHDRGDHRAIRAHLIRFPALAQRVCLRRDRFHADLSGLHQPAVASRITPIVGAAPCAGPMMLRAVGPL